ncbi:MAG: hypothetical protein KY469_00330 [Actinobacteria bacterium]|nr:hypothetical protein [Actinomycetota bacterium]
MIGLAAEQVALPPETIVRVRDGYALIETPSRRDFRDGNIIEVGEPDTTAASLYRRLGFRPHSHLMVVKQRATPRG